MIEECNSYTFKRTNLFLLLPIQINYSTEDVCFLKEKKKPKHKTTLDLYNLLTCREINAHIEKVVFCTEGKLLHQISDLL